VKRNFPLEDASADDAHDHGLGPGKSLCVTFSITLTNDDNSGTSNSLSFSTAPFDLAYIRYIHKL
jgi:hypothetical protein